MEIFLIFVLIGLLTFGYQWQQDKREQDLAARLSRLHDKNEASIAVDAVMVQSRRDAEFFSNLRDPR